MLDLARQRTIAVDFDGTIVDDNYPNIGKPKTFAFDTLKRLQNDGHRLILWTYRSGKSFVERDVDCFDQVADELEVSFVIAAVRQ